MNDIELYNEIGKNIKKARHNLGITQEKLAELTNYSLSFIANIESNTYQAFSISALNNISKVLNTNMASLLPKEKYLIEPSYLKCEYCSYKCKMPIEINNLLQNIKEIANKKIILTCPICHKKIVI